MMSAIKFRHHAKKIINPTRLNRNISLSNQVNKIGDIKINEEWKQLSGPFMKGKTMDSLIWHTDEVCINLIITKRRYSENNHKLSLEYIREANLYK